MNKIYSGFHQLPHGNASTMVQEGCIVLEGGAFRGLYGEGVLMLLCWKTSICAVRSVYPQEP